LGFQACPRRRGGGRMSWGSADLVPSSRPLRSESALDLSDRDDNQNRKAKVQASHLPDRLH